MDDEHGEAEVDMSEAHTSQTPTHKFQPAGQRVFLPPK